MVRRSPTTRLRAGLVGCDARPPLHVTRGPREASAQVSAGKLHPIVSWVAQLRFNDEEGGRGDGPAAVGKSAFRGQGQGQEQQPLQVVARVGVEGVEGCFTSITVCVAGIYAALEAQAAMTLSETALRRCERWPHCRLCCALSSSARSLPAASSTRTKPWSSQEVSLLSCLSWMEKPAESRAWISSVIRDVLWFHRPQFM